MCPNIICTKVYIRYKGCASRLNFELLMNFELVLFGLSLSFKVRVNCLLCLEMYAC